MSYGSQMTRARILDCARQEFTKYGYQNANMRRIAGMAQATTGALYNHFANKEVLFDALVQDPAEEMLALFRDVHRSVGPCCRRCREPEYGKRRMRGRTGC